MEQRKSRYKIERRRPKDLKENYAKRLSYWGSWKKSNESGETYDKQEVYQAMWDDIQRRLQEQIEYHSKEKGWVNFYVLLDRQIWINTPNAFHDVWISCQDRPPRKEGTMMWSIKDGVAKLEWIENHRRCQSKIIQLPKNKEFFYEHG